MRRIDNETVRKILDAADIVEVVSDFVQLKKRGSNYVGLCPFHNERTPSFSVSKSKGLCKCFSCGKGGSAVNFIMQLEQMTFNEALRYLANKYHIEIKEHEVSAEEREAENNRESMFAVNDFAMKFFEQTMQQTTDGRNIGLSYFRERGINDEMIRRFHLGYSPQGRSELFDTAISKGYSERFLLETGLCYRTDRGDVRDRFRGRVIYPVHTVSGKVIAFGGRTLSKDKSVAKYVNSPESAIYKKSRELYGLFQAKNAIVKKDKCILVEGYMDVISMHQSGVENVVASSGTSLTEGQIRLIHRFTENVTVIYDSDPAGIKASLRGIDMLLAEGLNVKVLSLPEGDDPDSFAQTHTSTEVERYLVDNEVDFIAFKTRILLDDVKNDPIERAKVISSIVRSISVIPDEITRIVYIGECSRTLGVDEKVLALQCSKYMAERSEKETRDREREANRIAAGLSADTETPETAVEQKQQQTHQETPLTANASFLYPYEHELARLVVRYGMMYLCDESDSEGNMTPMNVLRYVEQELDIDGIRFVNAGLMKVMDAVHATAADSWAQEWSRFSREVEDLRQQRRKEGIDDIRRTATDMAGIKQMEEKLEERVGKECDTMTDDFCERFLQRTLLSSPDDTVRNVATELCTQKHRLSKIHTKFYHVPTERERLIDLVPRAIYNLKEALVECRIRDIMEEVSEVYKADSTDHNSVMSLMGEIVKLNEYKKELSKYLGERVLTPRKR